MCGHIWIIHTVTVRAVWLYWVMWLLRECLTMLTRVVCDNFKWYQDSMVVCDLTRMLVVCDLILMWHYVMTECYHVKYQSVRLWQGSVCDLLSQICVTMLGWYVTKYGWCVAIWVRVMCNQVEWCDHVRMVCDHIWIICDQLTVCRWCVIWYQCHHVMVMCCSVWMAWGHVWVI